MVAVVRSGCRKLRAPWAVRSMATKASQALLESIEPFELVSVKPPTENASIAFRMTRGCYWMKCKYCGLDKLYDEAKFTKRSWEEVKADIDRAKRIVQLLEPYADRGGISQAQFETLLADIRQARLKAGLPFSEDPPPPPAVESPDLLWLVQCFKMHATTEAAVRHVLGWLLHGGRTAFLGDSDCMVVEPAVLLQTLQYLRSQLPTIERVTIYGKTRVCARGRTVEELTQYHKAGLDRVHFGVESGSDEVLRFHSKGASRADHAEAGRKINLSGLSCGTYVMPGLGGRRWSTVHARETAAVVNEMEPKFVRLRSLIVFPETRLAQAVASGEFEEGSEEQLVQEIRTLVERIDVETQLVSDSAGNLLALNGTLPLDRAYLLREIDEYLEKSPRERLVFNFISRYQSFVGQYGDIPADIQALLIPHLRGGRLDPEALSDSVLISLTKAFRSRLMP
eukprot:RCo014717